MADPAPRITLSGGGGDIGDPTGRVPRTRILARSEIKALVRAAGGRRHGLRNKALILTGYYTAARVSELCGMTWGGYDRARGRIRWWRPKIRDWHELALHPQAATALEALALSEQARFRPDRPVFASQKGGPLTTGGVRDIFAWLGRDAGIPEDKCHPHGLRSARCVHLIEDGASIAVVQRILAHARLSSTQSYIHLATGLVDSVNLGSSL